MKVQIPQDLQEELKHVVESYYKKQKKGKKSKFANKDKKEKKSRVLQAVSSAPTSKKSKTHKKNMFKKTRRADFAIEQRSYTYTNINGKEKKSSKEIIGDRNRIKITTVDPNGKKNVVTMPTPQNLLPNNTPAILPPSPFPNRNSFSSPFRSFKNDNMLLSLKPMMTKQSLLNPSYLR